jgi:hypothetical protein
MLTKSGIIDMKEKIKQIVLAELEQNFNIKLSNEGMELLKVWQDGLAEKVSIEIMALFNIPT